MIGCLDCERLERQLAACERKLMQQAEEWARQEAENNDLRAELANRKPVSGRHHARRK